MSAAESNALFIVKIVLIITLLLAAAGYFLGKNSGDELSKGVIKISKECQAHILHNKMKEYKDCVVKLDRIVNKMIADGHIDVKKCKKNPQDPQTALCPVTAWFKEQWVVTAITSVVTMVNKT